MFLSLFITMFLASCQTNNIPPEIWDNLGGGRDSVSVGDTDESDVDD